MEDTVTFSPWLQVRNQEEEEQEEESYLAAAVHVGSEPDRLAGAGAGLGPPGLPGEAGRIG